MKILMSNLVGVLILQCAVASHFMITTYEDTLKAHEHTNIIVGDVAVPPGVAFALLDLQNGTTVVFNGTVTFGYKEWEGPLMVIEGNHINVTGAPGHLIDGGGERWWDGRGKHGGIAKPDFFNGRLNHSTVTGLHFKNSPVYQFTIYDCTNLTISNVILDTLAGDINNLGHNTDGFDLKNVHNVVIRNSIVKNQDDCFALRSGSDIVFENNYCYGGHGISIGSVGNRRYNDVARAIMRNNVVDSSLNGIRVKTTLNATGSVTNVTFENIILRDILEYGIIIQGNYLNTGPKGEPTDTVPINGLRIHNIFGNVVRSGTNYFVWVKNASNWEFSNVAVLGGKALKKCQGFPFGVTHLC